MSPPLRLAIIRFLDGGLGVPVSDDLLTIETKDWLQYVVDCTATGEPMLLTPDGKQTGDSMGATIPREVHNWN